MFSSSTLSVKTMSVASSCDNSDIQALNVLSQYIKNNNGYIPKNPNQLISFSCSRYDLQTLNYDQAKNIISVYQTNVDRLRLTKKIKYRSTKKQIWSNLSLPKYSDIDGSSDSEVDIDDILTQNTTKILNRFNSTKSNVTTKSNFTTATNTTDNSTGILTEDLISLYMSQHPQNRDLTDPSDLIKFSSDRLSYIEAANIIEKYKKGKPKLSSLMDQTSDETNNSMDDEDDDDNIEISIRRSTMTEHNKFRLKQKCFDHHQVINKCKKTTKLDGIVFFIWFCMMIGTLFGISFGLIHIGYGINTLQESSKVTQETCFIYNYTKIECDNNKYKYEYLVQSVSKCGKNQSLSMRANDKFEIKELNECGKRYYDLNVNITCFIADCDKNEYSLIGFQDLTFSAKSDIELGCIVLIVTTVPFVSFICWVYFCYHCGPKR